MTFFNKNLYKEPILVQKLNKKIKKMNKLWKMN